MKLLFRTMVVLIVMGLALPLGVAQASTPIMPQVFYGQVTRDGGVSVTDGTTVLAEIDDQAYASTITSGGEYRLRVLGDDPAEPGKQGGEPGDTVVLKVNGVVVDSHDFEQGMFTLLDLVVTGPQPLTAEAGSYSGAVGEEITLEGSASGGTAPYTYLWDLDGGGEFDDSDVQNPSYTWDTAGDYAIRLQVTDAAADTATDTATVTVIAEGGFDWRDYDDDGDGDISKDEAQDAVDDYADGAGPLSKTNALEVVKLYFS